MALNIIQLPGVFFGYPNQGNHGRQGVSPIAICHHTFDGWWAFYQKIILGQAPGYQNTANYSITVDGVVRQHVADADAAWCNGLSWSAGGPAAHKSDLGLPWLAEAYSKRISPNCYTYSIELEGRSGTPLTAPQYASLVALDKKLMAQSPSITADRVHLVGHMQIDGINKQGCPGSAFPWTNLVRDLQPVAIISHVLASPDVWVGVGSGLIAYCKATPGFGLPHRAAATVNWYDDDHNEYLKTILNGHEFLHVYQSTSRHIETITWPGGW